MSIESATLTSIYQIDDQKAEEWASPISHACDWYEINTPLRIAAFLAQIGHESGRLRYVRELWGPTKWQLNYEGDAALGNTQQGDGFRFLGRGLIQVTGRANYEACGNALGLPLITSPELLERPVHAAMSAGWFWDCHHLNNLADAGDMHEITHRINGGYNGLSDRMALYERALQALQEGQS